MKTLRSATLVWLTVTISLSLFGVPPDPTLATPDRSQPYPAAPSGVAAGLAPRSDIPLPGDAEVIFSTREFIVLHTTATVDEAVEFYKQQMPAMGWESFTVTLQIQDVGCQSYIKDDEAAYIMITPGTEGTGVMIRVTGVGEPWLPPDADDTEMPDATPTAAPTAEPEPTEELRLMRGVPLLPDGVVDFSTADIVGYHTYVGVAEAAEFYEQEMPARGWQSSPDNAVAAEVANLAYTKATRGVSVLIYPGDGGQTYLLITLGAEG